MDSGSEKSSPAFAINAAATLPERCACRPESSRNASKTPNVLGSEADTKPSRGGGLFHYERQSSAKKAFDLFLFSGLRLQTNKQRYFDHDMSPFIML
jgi:hypothetical protein